MTFGKLALGLLGTAAGVLLLDVLMKSNAPAAPSQAGGTWVPADATIATIPGKLYRWSLVSSNLSTAQTLFAPSFSQLKAWPTISIPTDWPATDQGTDRIRFEGLAVEKVIFPSEWQPNVFVLS